MKRIKFLKTALAASIGLTMLMATAGCSVGGDDHRGDWDHRDDPHDFHQDIQQDNHQPAGAENH
jgi:hypothetical protein